MAPLSELRNQARPARRPAVYGRRRGVQAETREMHRQLFGTDENDLEKRLDKLTINAEPERKPPAPAPVCGPSPPKPELEVATHRPESQKLSTNKPAPRHNRPRKNADTPVAPSSLQSDSEAKLALVPSESKKTPSNGPSSKQKLAPTSQQPTIQSKSRYVLAAIPVSTDRVLRRQQKQPVRGKQKREMAVSHIVLCSCLPFSRVFSPSNTESESFCSRYFPPNTSNLKSRASQSTFETFSQHAHFRSLERVLTAMHICLPTLQIRTSVSSR